MKLTEKIDAYMSANKIKSLAQFAELVGVPYMTIRNFYIKGYGNAKRETLVKIKNVMGLTLDELADDTIEIDFTNRPMSAQNEFAANTVVTIGRGGERTTYVLNDEDAEFVDSFLKRFKKGDN